MSLKALKTVVDALREGSSQSCGRMDGCWACTDMENVKRAEAEIAALEKAAKTLHEAQPWAPVTVSTERWTQMRETIESIAKEAE